MRLLDILLHARGEIDTRTADARKARRRARPAVDGLERREVFTAGIVGPIAVAQVAAAAAPASTTTITQDQQGTAFGMQWRCTYDNQIGQYRLDIQGGTGSGSVSITRTKVGVQFNTNQYNAATGKFENVQVVGPALELNTWVKIRQFRNANDPNLTLGTGLYRTLETKARTTTSFVSTPTDQIKLTYEYDSIANTGKLTVANVRGTGRFVYSKAQINASVGDPRPDSPTANPVSSIDFQMQGSDYNGGIGVFVPGKADAAITVVVTDATRSGFYKIERGAW
jgi:hypothetical protein